jgi:GNAT superfamily N-acetyltransferase
LQRELPVSISVRRLTPSDTATIETPLFELVSRFAVSFVPERAAFRASLRAVFADESAWLCVAEEERAGPGAPESVSAEAGGESGSTAGAGALAGYCLGFDHPAFYANGRVAWVEEIMVREDLRGRGVGRLLMDAFEEWASTRGDRLIALATRRAAPFYEALGYEDSATYFRKAL